MSKALRHTPIYKQFIELISNGTNLLDDEIRGEVTLFVSSSQLPDGSFPDRGGNSDWYYSLFGYWLSEGLHQKVTLENLHRFVLNANQESTGSVNRFSKILILLGFGIAKPSIYHLLKSLLSRRYQGDLSYKLFLFLLLIDARFGKRTGFAFLLRTVLRFYSFRSNMPCSLLAALLVARNEVGLNNVQLQTELLTFFHENGGFRLFKHIDNSDMLSTAVALFALKTSGYDVRLLASSCLSFIQDNYSQGAFLSGDGDVMHDLEYTFYGLLALGVLNPNKGNG